MPKNETFAARLKALRGAAELSQSALASRAGMTTYAISALECGRRHPSWPTICALADAMSLPTDRFRVDK